MFPAVQSASRIGLVLTGGGARAAYQAGALRALSEILGPAAGRAPFGVISGISAGAINAAFVASHADEFARAAREAVRLWGELDSKMILRDDLLTMSRLAGGILRDLVLGGSNRKRRSVSNHLLDTTPLRGHLERILDVGGIPERIREGRLRGFAVTATDYRTGRAVTFFDGDPEIAEWKRSSRIGTRSPISLEHVLASAAIPVLFEPVLLGPAYYGDGSVSLKAPLSPAIHLGARKLLVIGIRHRADAPAAAGEPGKGVDPLAMIDVAGVLLNSLLMEDLESDIERLVRINQALAHWQKPEDPDAPGGIRAIPILTLRPSLDLGGLAQDQFSRFPRLLRHLLRGIGASDEKGWDMLSYLSFDSSYTRAVIDLGRRDTLARAGEIREFFGPEKAKRPVRAGPGVSEIRFGR